MSVEVRETENDAEVAAALSRELSEAGQARRITVRSLRDRFGRPRLTAAGRAQISRALEGAGIQPEPGLEQASLDDEVVLRLRRRGALPSRLGPLFRRGTRAWKAGVAFLGFLATVTGLYAFAAEWLSDPVRRQLSGDLNLAVAPFSASATGGESDAEGVGDQLASQVTSTTKEYLDRRARRTEVTFDIAPPPPVEPVEGGTAGERAAAAARSAEEVNADVLVYGTARVTPDTTVVAPSFYISERLLEDAEELVGTHQLGEPIDVLGSLASSPAARIELRNELAARARTLSDFVLGLSHFEQGDYRMASRWFRQAEEASGGTALEVIYLFLGHAAGRLGAIGEAEGFYARALEVNPGYVRAKFGISEVRFQRSHHDCEPGRADEAGLLAALRGFERVEAGSQPYGAVLGVRSRLGRAQVLLCLSQAEIVARWDEARGLFLGVVDAYDRGEHQLREEASVALGGLGLIHLPSRGEREPEPMLLSAASYYERALRLSLDASQQGVFWGMLGFIYGELGRVDEADRAYQRAARLNPSSAQKYERKRRALLEP